MSTQPPVSLPHLLVTQKPTPEQIRMEFDLPFSKKHVVVLRGTGRDKRQALLAAGPGADPLKISDAIAARLCLIDGKRLRMEDFDDLDFDDSMAISEAMGKVLSPLGKAAVIEKATLPLDEEADQVELPRASEQSEA